MKKEILIFGIIFLFVGVGIQPAFAIDISNEANNNELKEVTFQVYSMNKIKDYTIRVDAQKINEFDQLILKVKSELENIQPHENSFDIINNFIISLFDIGFFPKDFNINEIQESIFQDGYNSFFLRLFDRFFDDKFDFYKKSDNAFCAIYGQSSYVNYFYYLPTMLSYYYYVFYGWYWYPGIFKQRVGAQFLPVKASSIMTLGKNKHKTYWGEIIETYKSQGWVWTQGVKGIKNWNGKFLGGFFNLDSDNIFLPSYYYWSNPVGVILFRGLNIYIPNNVIFLGTARYVKINS